MTVPEPVRIAHVTDIHWMTPPGAKMLTGKRLLGTANLYLAGRRHHFSEEVQAALIDHVIALDPDVLVVTGDLTAQALPAEFAKARAALQPALDRFPTFVIPGNHDVYTAGAQRESRIRAWFGDWMGLRPESPVSRLDHRNLTILGLDPNRPTWLGASGVLPEDQLVALAEELNDPRLSDRLLLLAVHYPILDRRGAVYDGKNHGLLNARALIDVLERAPRRPDLVLHGHEHHGFRVDLSLSDARIPVFDCGSSGYAHLPGKARAAAMNLYTVRAPTIEVDRYLYTAQGFAPEPGGAYATGR